MALNKRELKELDGLYRLIYKTECFSARDLRRAYELEDKATDREIRKLLKKYGVNYEEVFG